MSGIGQQCQRSGRHRDDDLGDDKRCHEREHRAQEPTVSVRAGSMVVRRASVSRLT